MKQGFDSQPGFIPAGAAISGNRLRRRMYTVKNEVVAGNGLCLDFGAGKGEKRIAVESKGWSWIGFDIVWNRGVSLVADGHHLPFKDNTFPSVFMCQVLEHVPDPWEAMKEVARVIQPGGLLMGSVSFLEPFHDSYFHMSHIGVCRLLRSVGFTDITVSPGTHAATHYLHYLPGLPIFARDILGLLVAATICFSYWLAMKIMALFQNGKVQKHWKNRVGELPLTLAGNVLFRARRLQGFDD